LKIALIEPSAAASNVYSKIPMPLLGPLYLGAILKQRGHDVTVYNEDISQPDYRTLDADLIGVSILTSTAKRGYKIAGHFPKEKVIIGGVHASLLPQEALQYARQVVVGEAEDVIVDVAEGRMRDPIVQGRPVENLDSLPYPDFSLLKGYRPSFSIVPVSTSRGCPFDCTFCSVTKMFGREYRFRSANNVIAELSSKKKARFFFCDDNFTANPLRARRLLELMITHKIRDWACQVRCDIAKDKDFLALMSRAGCSVVCVGLESVNTETLKAYQKKQSVDDIMRAVSSFHRNKIKVHGMFVLGGDNDSEHTVWETLRFAIKQKIDTIQMMILTPLPGTRVYDDLRAQKRIFSHDWDLYDGQHVVFSPKLLSARELQASVGRAYAKFYSLSHIFLLLVKLHFRNALFRFMGYRIVRQWLQRNGGMRWVQP
jgi:anaerobic magnesium-protoporphyrin IX monomethyl ester cyclase